MHQVLINGKWQPSQSVGSFTAMNPQTGEALADVYPVSSWEDLDQALNAAQEAFVAVSSMPTENLARFLERYAEGLDAQSDAIREAAHLETALPLDTRLVGEMGRTTGQLQQAAAAVRTASWTRPIIDTANGIRSCLAGLGPVAVFGPNNFPLAFGGVSGGDFAAALAAGNPVIAKANPMHPRTTQLLAEVAKSAAEDAGLPEAMVQLVYHMEPEVGLQLVQDPRLAAVAFTGSRRGGLALKAAADEVGKPIYLELSSVNPVVMLPGALSERGAEIATELVGSCTMGAGQFCTNPGLVLLVDSPEAQALIDQTVQQMREGADGVLFSESGVKGLQTAIDQLCQAGAECLCGGQASEAPGFRFQNTVLKVSGTDFLKNSDALQTEAFGASTLFVVTESVAQMIEILMGLEGNLTGCLYSAQDGSDDADYDRLAAVLRPRVGRLINDKMPTGVAVSPAMQHGGPFPSTGHPGFTAVGLPASIERFAMRQCFDQVRANRLPSVLQDQNPGGVWRCVDGQWTTGDLEQ